jgi:hypothetical protein
MAGLLEEVRERVVVEQVFRVNGWDIERNRLSTTRRHGAMASPPKVPNALHVTIDPQLVHDLAQTFHAGVGKKRAKILWFVQASRFHAFENESGVFAQPTHGGCSINHRGSGHERAAAR